MTIWCEKMRHWLRAKRVEDWAIECPRSFHPSTRHDRLALQATTVYFYIYMLWRSTCAHIGRVLLEVCIYYLP